jgi:hypothetical protein
MKSKNQVYPPILTNAYENTRGFEGVEEGMRK